MSPDTDTNNDINGNANPSPNAQQLATSLVTRCRTLISEIDAFHALLTDTQRNPQVVEARSIRSNTISELRTLEKLAAQIDAEPVEDDDIPETHKRLTHALRSSNLPFYEAVWTIAKRSCTGLVGFGKRFYRDGDSGGGWDEGHKKRPNKDKRKSVFVDIVADGGEEWVKVSTVSETRLLFEMAEKGWEADSEAGSDEEEPRTVLRNYDGDRRPDGASDNTGSDGDEDDDEVELVKLAREMRRASDNTRVRYRHPRLRFVIPKIEEGKIPEIDDLLKAIRGYGVQVDCGEAVFSSEAIDLDQELRRLLPKPFKRFASTLNVDCTLLLAIVSDLSHFKNIPPSPTLHRAILRQLEVERSHPLLTKELWPAMVDHDLVCTKEAAERMREIVETIGTDSEKQRTWMIMGIDEFRGLDSPSLLQRLQALSDHPIPSQWKLPIKTVDSISAIALGRKEGVIPLVADRVTEILSDINHSVFMYGWASKLMTISSNRTVVKQIEMTVEKHREGDEELEGPLIWVCDTARSLIGKEKSRKN
ncbi:hypothetical protein FE257_001427 [Aspergillus nanangensis]|uniref:DUF1308 domain-containing protein n=1 Tax=Aspergillus nanangensis TaxID=2582783 RepID=A0AAD4GPN3_ASPNN|nr:hypothetical protein FE257_001427 [Aspergillus nanangensis]